MNKVEINNSKVDHPAFTLVSELISERNEDVNDCPHFLSLDWSDTKVLNDNRQTFLSILAYNSIYPDEAIMQKLGNTKLLKSVAKWVISLESIIAELEILKSKYPQIDALYFAYYLIYFITNKSKISFSQAIIEDKSELNISSIIENYFKQSRVSPKSNLKGVKKTVEFGLALNRGLKEKNTKEQLSQYFNAAKDPIEMILRSLIQSHIAVDTSKYGRKNAMKQLIGLYGLDPYVYMRSLPIDELEKNYPKNALYRDLFPLFKLILKDKDLLSEEEHKKDSPDTYYNIYMVNQVKIILGKTRKKN
jgi:hypothetical protein